MSKENLNVQLGTTPAADGIFIEVTRNGPYVVHGISSITQQFIMPDGRGSSVAYQEGESFTVSETTALCRCGLSKNKPYCDGSHMHAAEYGVDLTETASFEPLFNGSQEIDGPVISLTDNERYCAYARFCDYGKTIWNEVQEASTEAQKRAIAMAHHCPSGRLIVWDNQAREPIETPTEPSLGLIEDYVNRCSAGIMVQGGIPVKSGNGTFYEVRNRQTLCRCGQSSNKPFCDGSHASIKFQDQLDTEPNPDGKKT